MNEKEFLASVKSLFKTQSKLLVLIRYHAAAGSKDYVIVEGLSDVIEVIERCQEKDSITVFKNYEEVVTGMITKDLIEVLSKTIASRFKEELLIVFDSFKDFKNNKDYCFDSWEFIEDVEELTEFLKDNLNRNITCIVDLEFWNEENTINLYVPDKCGISRAGTY